MKLYLSQSAALNSTKEGEHDSKVLEVFANYIRAPQRNTVTVLRVSEVEQKDMKLEEVRFLFDCVRYRVFVFLRNIVVLTSSFHCSCQCWSRSKMEKLSAARI